MLKVDPKKTISYRPDDRDSAIDIIISAIIVAVAIALLVVPLQIWDNHKRQNYVTQCMSVGHTESECLLRWRELRIAGGSS